MALATVQESLDEDDEDPVCIEIHAKNAYAEETESVYFEIKVTGQEPVCCWYFNGQELKFDPRYKTSTHGLWRKLIVSKVKKSDDGIYTVVCSNDFSFAESQATLTVTDVRPVDINYKNPNSTLYLSWPKSQLRIKKNLRNLRVLPGHPIKLRVELINDENISPNFVWYKNNRQCLFDDGIQTIENNRALEYVKFVGEIRDSAIYTVVITDFIFVFSSSAEVIVMDPLQSLALDEQRIWSMNSGSPSFYKHLPENLEFFETEEIRLTCKANIDSDTTVEWLRNDSIICENDKITFENMESRGVSMKIVDSNRDHRGLYTVVIKNNKTGNEQISQCRVFIDPLPKADIPKATVEHPLDVVITSIGTKVCLYCKFGVPRNKHFFVVWRVGIHKIERPSSQFTIINNKLGMNVLFIRNVDPDMLGEVSCELRLMLPLIKRSVHVIQSKGLLVHVPREAMEEESYGDNTVWAEKAYTDMHHEKTTVLYYAEDVQLPSDEKSVDDDSSDDKTLEDDEGRQDEAAACPLEGTLTPETAKIIPVKDAPIPVKDAPIPDKDAPIPDKDAPIPVKDAPPAVPYSEETMEFAYCRLREEYCHFLKIISCKRSKMLIISETEPEDPDISKNFIHIEWANKRELPPNTTYVIEMLQPSGNYYRCGTSCNPVLTISAVNAGTLMLFRIRVIAANEKTPEASFIVCPPSANEIMPQTAQRLLAEEFISNYTRLGVIGNGAYGTVEWVQDKNGDSYAAKIVKTRLERRRLMTCKEIKMLENLHHKRIVQLYAFYMGLEQSVLVMEFLWGEDLFVRLFNDENFNECMAVHYVRQICEGLEYLHGQNIVHLDVKPENVVCVSPNSLDIKIVDFGLSKVLGNNLIRALYGTRDYIAPEVLNFEAIKTSSDMWSLGILTYAMLSGTVPFLGAHWMETAVNITRGKFDYANTVFDSVSDEAKDFINGLLVLNPDDRLTATAAMQHRWIVETSEQGVTLGQIKRWKSNLKTYMKSHKDHWQRLGNVVIAANRFLIGAHRDSKLRVLNV